MNNEKKFIRLTPFKMQVLQSFPFIDEDFDAITNYELLCKVVEYLNTTVDNVNLLDENFTTLYNYVHDYFDNLDVQAEINQKLDNMAVNGELEQYFAKYVNPILDAQNSKISIQDQKIAEQDEKIQEQDNKIARINASPLVATSTSEMTDTNRIYVNTTDGYWYYYNGTEWIQGGIYQSTGVETDTTLTQAGVPADAKATGDRLEEKINKNGIGEVYSKNIYGMAESGESKISGNILNQSTFYGNGYADINPNTNKLRLLGVDSGLMTYTIKTSGLRYYFPNGTARTLVKLASDMETAIGSTLTYVSEVSTDDCSYIAFSYNPTNTPNFELREELKVYNIPNNWTFKGLEYITKSTKVSGAINNGDSLIINDYDNLISDKQIIFKAFLNTFDRIRICFNSFGNNTLQNYVEVGVSNLVIKNSSTPALIYQHGLSINTDLTILIEINKQKLSIEIITHGTIYKINNIDLNYNGGTSLSVRVLSLNTETSDSTIEANYKACQNDLWYFGDSYLSFINPARWTYYLDTNLYGKNTLFNGIGGCTTGGARRDYNSIIKYGNPKYVVIATGMNDGTDTNNTPSSTWLTAIQGFIQDIINNGGTPILCTIPTIPSVNNESKNNWIKNSGYRYIDFAKAVGANSSGVWYDGMLSSDNIHPSELGAKALYSQVLLDLPEIYN